MTDKPVLIAVIDDDEAVRESLAAVLAAYKFDVLAFASGEEFLENSRSSTAECLLLDLNLASSTAWDVLAALADAGLSPPVIIITGRADGDMQEKAAKWGVARTLEKPVRPRTLMDAIDGVLTPSN